MPPNFTNHTSGQCLVGYKYPHNLKPLVRFKCSFLFRKIRGLLQPEGLAIRRIRRMCVQISKHYHHNTSLAKHRRLEHPVNQGTIHCQEQGCTYKCRYIAYLQNHLSSVHNVIQKFENETLLFTNKKVRLYTIQPLKWQHHNILTLYRI